MATVAAYFVLPTDLTTREAERIIDSTHIFFKVGNSQGVGFLDSSVKLTLFSDLANCKVDIIFFTARSTVTASDIDQRFPSTTSSLEFSLRLLQSFSSNYSAPAQYFPTINTPEAPLTTNTVTTCSISSVYSEATTGSTNITILTIAYQLIRAEFYRKEIINILSFVLLTLFHIIILNPFIAQR